MVAYDTEHSEREPVEDWVTDFDHFDPTFVADPYPIYDEIRSACPVAHSDRYGGMNVTTTFADVSEAAHDYDRFTSRRIIISEVSTARRGVILPPINIDPPDHTAVRRVMLPFFNPANIKRWEAPIRQICARRLDDIDARVRRAAGSDPKVDPNIDLALDFARHVPGDLMAAMFGLPESEAEWFRQWVHELLEIGPTDADVERKATRSMLDYMTNLIDERRPAPGSSASSLTDDATTDLVSYLFDQQIDEAPIDDLDMAKMLFLLLLAGIDTTWSAMGSAFLHLATHSLDRQRLVDEPELIPTATEELLRAYSPVHVGRIATRDTEIAGCPVAEGEWVMLGFPAANRDPAAFENPDHVQIDRQKNRHVAFGLGVHRCLGSNLARLELNIALEMLLDRFPNFELVPGTDTQYSSGAVRGPRNVPVSIG